MRDRNYSDKVAGLHIPSIPSINKIIQPIIHHQSDRQEGIFNNIPSPLSSCFSPPGLTMAGRGFEKKGCTIPLLHLHIPSFPPLLKTMILAFASLLIIFRFMTHPHPLISTGTQKSMGDKNCY